MEHKNKMAAPSASNHGLVKNCRNHNEKLSRGLRNRFQNKRGVDVHIRQSDGSVRLHRLVLDVFKSTDKLVQHPQKLANGQDNHLSDSNTEIKPDEIGNHNSIHTELVPEPQLSDARTEPFHQEQWDWQSRVIKCEVSNDSIEGVVTEIKPDEIINLNLVHSKPVPAPQLSGARTEPIQQEHWDWQSQVIKCEADDSCEVEDIVNDPIQELTDFAMEPPVHQDRNNYQCGRCLATFKEPLQLSLHLQEHAPLYKGDLLFRCGVCGDSFDYLDHVQRHVLTHQVHCDLCNRMVNGKNGDHEGCIGKKRYKQYTCDKCDYVFSKSITFRNHIAHDHPKSTSLRTNLPSDRSHKCELCPSTFSNGRHLKSHVTRCHSDIVAPVARRTCSYCKVSFSSIGRLNRHLITKHKIRWNTSDTTLFHHAASRSHRSVIKCEVTEADQSCEVKDIVNDPIQETSEGSADLAMEPPVHQERNNSITRSVNNEDDSKFNLSQVTKTGLMDKSDSLASTSVQDPYQCGRCLAPFKEPLHLSLHLQEHAPLYKGDLLFRCGVCGDSFDYLDHVQRHALTHQVHCDLCNQMVNGKNGDHEGCIGKKRYKQYPCDKCDCVFRKRTTLKNHIDRSHHKSTRLRTNLPSDRSHKCEFCPSTFRNGCSLKSHVARCHSDIVVPEARHTCSYCMVSVSSIGRLNRHLITKHNITLNTSDSNLIHHATRRSRRCVVCDKGFESLDALQEHSKAHCP